MYISKKKGLKSQNPKFNIFWKIAFWNKQKWLNKNMLEFLKKLKSINKIKFQK